tara:strand:- start:171 stop:374 length:204 start_codon:yes stop_codon:yes gene_type:complete
MNERIKELALQSGLEMCSCGCDMPTRQSAAFAKLIIQECAGKVDWILAGSPESDKTQGDIIREHFGV